MKPIQVFLVTAFLLTIIGCVGLLLFALFDEIHKTIKINGRSKKSNTNSSKTSIS
jgi:hypothetical protein